MDQDPKMNPKTDVTLIVAATRNMGIGRNGTLPWTGLRKEIAYFARVTKRVSPSSAANAVNAVVMGRRTWESIPPRFRPLADRLNVVLTSHPLTPASSSSPSPMVITATSMDDALAKIRAPRWQQQQRRQPKSKEDTKNSEVGKVEGNVAAEEEIEEESRLPPVSRIFVIGGMSVYAAALQRTSETRRVLLTRVESDFDCDTFFPVRLGSSCGKDEDDGVETEKGWVRRGRERLSEWVGERVPEGTQTEAGVEYEFQLWEREVDR